MNDALVGMFTVAVVVLFAYLVFPAAMAVVERLLKRWEKKS